MSLLDEESHFPQSTDNSFVQKLNKYCEEHPRYIANVYNKPVFTIKHYAEQVSYKKPFTFDIKILNKIQHRSQVTKLSITVWILITCKIIYIYNNMVHCFPCSIVINVDTHERNSTDESIRYLCSIKHIYIHQFHFFTMNHKLIRSPLITSGAVRCRGLSGEEPRQPESRPRGLSTQQQQWVHQGPVHGIHVPDRNHLRVSDIFYFFITFTQRLNENIIISIFKSIPFFVFTCILKWFKMINNSIIALPDPFVWFSVKRLKIKSLGYVYIRPNKLGTLYFTNEHCFNMILLCCISLLCWPIKQM